MRPKYFGHAHPESRANTIDRRRFVVWTGGTLLLSACGKYPQALLEPSSLNAPGADSALVNVKDAGARGDGVTDDTEAINAAVVSLGAQGGTVWLPAGTYLIDPTRSVQLLDNVTLMLDPAATLRAFAVSRGASAVITASSARNIAVTGGSIVGERVSHLGATGEWGMGIRILGCSNVRIEGVQISDCWGDGIYIGAAGVGKESQNVSITKCSSRNNRRQGLSITGCRGATVRDSEFTDTKGTLPESGIDLEPNERLNVVDVVIDNCLIARNAGHGVLLVGAGVRNAQIVQSQIADNGLAGAAFVRGVNQSRLSASTIQRNGSQGVLLDSGFHNDVLGNDIRRNSRAQPGLYPNVLLSNGSSNNTIAENRFGELRRLIPTESRDIVVTEDCHDNMFELATVVDSGGKRRP